MSETDVQYSLHLCAHVQMNQHIKTLQTSLHPAGVVFDMTGAISRKAELQVIMFVWQYTALFSPAQAVSLTWQMRVSFTLWNLYQGVWDHLGESLCEARRHGRIGRQILEQEFVFTPPRVVAGCEKCQVRRLLQSKQRPFSSICHKTPHGFQLSLKKLLDTIAWH